MMTGALLVTAAWMGLAGSPHCAAMCATGCALTARRCRPDRPAGAVAAMLLARLLAYAVAGAGAAAVVGGLRGLAGTAMWLRPLWTGLQLALLLLGLWMLWRGALPLALQAWLERGGTRAPLAGEARVHLPGELRAAGLALLWPALPCGLLHAALLLAAVASSPAEGAAVMAVFAAASVPGLLLGPVIWLRWMPARWREALGGRGEGAATALPLRLAGAMIALLAGVSLGIHLGSETLAAWCA